MRQTKYLRLPFIVMTKERKASQCMRSNIDSFSDILLLVIVLPLVGCFTDTHSYASISETLITLLPKSPHHYQPSECFPLSTSNHKVVLVGPKIYADAGCTYFAQPKHITLLNDDLPPRCQEELPGDILTDYLLLIPMCFCLGVNPLTEHARTPAACSKRILCRKETCLWIWQYDCPREMKK